MVVGRGNFLALTKKGNKCVGHPLRCHYYYVRQHAVNVCRRGFCLTNHNYRRDRM